MSQTLTPLDGGKEQIIVNNFSPNDGGYLSEQYTAVRNLKPIPTEWREGGRPIYDRLPGVSERYKVDFGYDKNVAYTYIPTGQGYTGSTSMVVEATADKKYLVIQGGNIVWEYGTLATIPVVIDLEAVGMGSSKYLLAYQLYYDDSAKPLQFEVSDFSLSGFKMDIRSNTDAIVGWRYTPQYAFVGSLDSDIYWSNCDPKFLSYSGNAELSWQLPAACSFSKIRLTCPPKTSYTGTASLYYMSCSDAIPGEFCDNPIWTYAGEVPISESVLGNVKTQFYEFNISSPITCKGWKVEWSDPKVSIRGVSVSGIITLDKKPATLTTNYALVAYPVNSIPSKFTNSEGEEVPLIMCKLAHVDVDASFTVTKVQDIREVVYNSFEPIAEWLTRPWDENLISLYNTVSKFEEYWLTPQTALMHEYSTMEDNGAKLLIGPCQESLYQEI